MKKISIIIPVYNVEKYIDGCLKSLVNQTLEDIEIIVVNDGSPDDSQKIIDKYQKKYPNKVKSYIKENGGQGSARNFGLTKATGKYIMYVDSDDTIDLNMCEELYNEINNKNCDVVICGNKVVAEDGKILKEESAYPFANKDNNLINLLFGKMAVWNKIYKKDLIVNNKILFRSKVWYEDLDFSVKTLLMAKNVSFIDKPFYNYLLREGSTMNNSNINRNLEILDAFDEVIKYCKNKKIYKKYYNELEFLAIDHIYISAIVRVIRAQAPKKNKKVIINKMKDYMTINFASFKNNKYKKLLNMNKKLIYHLINLKLYGIINMLFNLKAKLYK